MFKLKFSKTGYGGNSWRPALLLARAGQTLILAGWPQDTRLPRLVSPAQITRFWRWVS
jgi:hypothetical protein